MTTEPRKYAALPDLDTAPDVYETPELTEDGSTQQTSTVRSESPSSEYEDASSSGVVRQRLRTDEARSVFDRTNVDAKGVDFSDSISTKRKSYITSSRRRGPYGIDAASLSEEEDEDDTDESLDRRLARLKLEVEQVQAALERRDAEPNAQRDSRSAAAEDSVSSLSKILDGLQAGRTGSRAGAEAQFAKKLATASNAEGTPDVASDPSAKTAGPRGASSSASLQDQSLGKIADFDGRLALLEKALGIGSTALPHLDRNKPSVTVIPSLEHLTKQIHLLSSTSASSLDGVSRKVRQLTQEAEKLDEARRTARESQEDLPSGVIAEIAKLEDAEQRSKVNALYGTLASIESLAPLLPMVIERLRSLRLVHAEAGNASEALTGVEKQLDSMASEVKTWSQGLDKLEAKMAEADRVAGTNMKTVEATVADLEKRVQNLR